jgi:hypothetical protein
MSQSLGSRDQVIDPASNEVIEFSFAPPAFVTVKIAGLAEHPNRNDIFAEVTRVGAKRDRFSTLLRRLDEGSDVGARRHGPLVPGEYAVELLYGSRSMPELRTMDRKVVELKSGDDITIELTARALHSFTVLIPREYRGSQLHLRNLADPQFHAYQAKTGVEEYTFTELVAGTYELSDRTTGAMFVTLPQAGGGRIEFAPLPFKAVRLTDHFGQWDGKDVGLKPGDIVISMGGSAVATQEQFYKLLEEVRKGEETTWVVERAGTRVSVTFKTADWNAVRLHAEPALAN